MTDPTQFPDFPDLPDFLKIPREVRAQAWRDNPPRRSSAGTGPSRRKPCWWSPLWPERWLDDPAQYAALKQQHLDAQAKKSERLEKLRARREAQ